MVRVKICGITNLKDAMFCCAHGADAIGFVFYKNSPRYISAHDAKGIIKELPPFISVVGLFVNEDAAKVRRVYDECGLNVLQFHGDEESSYVNGFNCKKIKAFRVKESIDVDELNRYDVDAYLFDSAAPGLYGGSGTSFGWDVIKQHRFARPVILAGGLDTDNIVAAVSMLKPYAVDVSSGVEQEKGIKDFYKVKKFIIRAKHGRDESKTK